MTEKLERLVARWRADCEGLGLEARRWLLKCANELAAVLETRENASDATALRAEVEEREGAPATCKVWRGEELVFDGVARSALLEDGRLPMVADYVGRATQAGPGVTTDAWGQGRGGRTLQEIIDTQDELADRFEQALPRDTPPSGQTWTPPTDPESNPARRTP